MSLPAVRGTALPLGVYEPTPPAGGLLPRRNGDFAQVRASIARHGKSFALASVWFDAGLRDDVAALYAFCRRMDDAIDLCDPADAGRLSSVLAQLWTEVEQIYGGVHLADPVLSAFQSVALRCEIPKRYVQELLLGMRMDVENTRYEQLSDLLLYCHRVAGVVGLMMCHVLPARRQSALRHAAHLGVAMQLTNICRDVAEDQGRGRCYLPQRWLAQLGSPERVVQALLQEADRYYRSGEAGLLHLPVRAALAVRTARHVYAAIGSVLRRRRYAIHGPRARVSTLRKLALVLRSLLGAVSELPARLRAAERPAQTRRLSPVRYEDVLPL